VFRTHSHCVDVSIEWQFWGHEYINQLLKPDLELGREIALQETPTLKLLYILALLYSAVYPRRKKIFPRKTLVSST